MFKLRVLFILGLFAFFPTEVLADNPPVEEITVIPEREDPAEEPLDLSVYLNSSTSKIYIEFNGEQWLWVYILNTDTATIYSVDIIDVTQNNGSVYRTYAPSQPGNYRIHFQSNSAEANGYFSIY